ncbi:MAG: diacylglycerol/polyprenol kinase family protein [Candidatus Kapaibacterium sp.]
MIDYSHEGFAILITLALYGTLFAGAEFLYRKLKLDPEVSRKITHIVGGFIALALPLLFQSYWTVVILGLVFFLTLLTTKRSGVVQSVHNVERQTAGELYFPLALAVIFTLSSITDTFHLYTPVMLALALGDSAAWYVGSRYGKHRYHLFGERKSVEGSIAIAVVIAIIATVSLILQNTTSTLFALLLGVGTGVLISTLEAVSPRGTDNLTVPIGMWGALVGIEWMIG